MAEPGRRSPQIGLDRDARCIRPGNRRAPWRRLSLVGRVHQLHHANGWRGPRFPYAPTHYAYINIAKEMKLGRTSGWVTLAERVDQYAPVPGDVICFSRERVPLKYGKLPLHRFASHCDIVVSRDKGQLSVIGGNVDHAVTMKHVPVTMDGRLADSDDRALDTRYPWFVVLRILYDR